MRTDLLALELSQALEVLKGEGVVPVVRETCAPRRVGAEGGTLRVVCAEEGGRMLTVARFYDPLRGDTRDFGK